MRFEELSTICVILHGTVLLTATLEGSSSFVWGNTQKAAHIPALLQQESRAGPGKQLRNQQSPEISCFALKKKKRKKGNRIISKIQESHRTNSPSSHPLSYYGTRRNLWIINMKVPLTRQLSRSSASISHPPARLFASSVAAEKLECVLHWAAERQQSAAPEHSRALLKPPSFNSQMSFIYIHTHTHLPSERWGQQTRKRVNITLCLASDKKEALHCTNLRWTQQLHGW